MYRKSNTSVPPLTTPNLASTHKEGRASPIVGTLTSNTIPRAPAHLSLLNRHPSNSSGSLPLNSVRHPRVGREGGGARHFNGHPGHADGDNGLVSGLGDLSVGGSLGEGGGVKERRAMRARGRVRMVGSVGSREGGQWGLTILFLFCITTFSRHFLILIHT